MPRQHRVRPQRVPWLVLGASIALTAGAAAILAGSARARDDARFRNAMQAADDRIAGRLNVYVATLRGGVALFAASDTVNAMEFRSYVERLDVQRSFPGIQGIGYSRRLQWQIPGEIDERHAILYIEPRGGRNVAAGGFDMYSEPERRMAMKRARDLGEPAMSGRVRLVQEIHGDTQPGFLIYVPVYSTGDIPPTVEARRERLAGHVFAAFRADDLFAGIFGSEQFPRVSFTVYDAPSRDSATVLYRSPRASSHIQSHTGSTRLEIAGRTWTVVYSSQPQFERSSGRTLVPALVTVGLLFSIWLFWLARRLSHERQIAETASQAKSAFLANMSHELRTPLNAIGGYVDLMQLGIPDPVTASQQEYLERIQHAQAHLLGLINDVLHFAKIEAGRIEYRIEPARVNALVSEAIAMVLPSAQKCGVHLESNGGPDVHVAGDPDKVRQIVLNLLTNAVKFSSADGRVEVYWKVADERVEVSVHDAGVGIDPSLHEQIFEAFVQGDADLTRERQGTGLGLSISRALARGMNGDITVSSTKGEGSTFRLMLPLAHV